MGSDPGTQVVELDRMDLAGPINVGWHETQEITDPDRWFEHLASRETQAFCRSPDGLCDFLAGVV